MVRLSIKDFFKIRYRDMQYSRYRLVFKTENGVPTLKKILRRDIKSEQPELELQIDNNTYFLKVTDDNITVIGAHIPKNLPIDNIETLKLSHITDLFFSQVYRPG